MTRHLGSFGKSHAPQDEEVFEFLGEEFKLSPDVSELEFLDFMSKANAIDMEASDKAAAQANAMSTLKEYLSNVVHESDRERFWATAKKHRQSIEDLMTLANGLTEALNGVPTGRPSVSSTGRPDTEPSSKEDVSSRALEILNGRPDLQMAVLHAQESRTNKEAALQAV